MLDQKRAGLCMVGLMGLVALGLSAAGCGDEETAPPRAPRSFDIPFDMSLIAAIEGAVAGDTLNILSSPPPLTETLTVNSNQTPLLIRGGKVFPLFTTLGPGAILRFVSPQLGTRISEIGFSGGSPAVQVQGSGDLVIEDATFTGGDVQVLGTGDGLKVEVTGSLLRRAGRFSLEMADGALLVASHLTIDEAGDCGILFHGGATGFVGNTIIWRSVNYGIACGAPGDLISGSGCNDIHQSGTASYLNCTPPDTTNFNEDPLFCDADNNDYTIPDISRCSPLNSLGCGLIGARNPGVCAP